MKKKIVYAISGVVVIGFIFGVIILNRHKPQEKLSTPSEQNATEKIDSIIVLSSEFDKIETNFPILEFNNGKLVTLPPVPFLSEGCEGEWCGRVKSLKLTQAATIYRDADKKSEVIAKLEIGEELSKANIFTKTLSVQKLPDNEIVLHYNSETMYLIAKPDLDLDDVSLDPDEVKDLKTESWVYVETSKGIRGWVSFYEQVDASPTAIFETEY